MNELQQRILSEAESWIGTPWREGGSCVKGPGGGVDCSRYVLAVFNACGLCDMYTVPIVPGVYCMNRKNPSLILEFLCGHPELCAEVQDDNYQPCDMITFREGMVIHHVGIVLEDCISMVSCRQPQGVSKHVFKGDDYFKKRVNKAFRPVALCQ
jgi:cell wall-associated NlpC family hydrolase